MGKIPPCSHHHQLRVSQTPRGALDTAVKVRLWFRDDTQRTHFLLWYIPAWLPGHQIDGQNIVFSLFMPHMVRKVKLGLFSFYLRGTDMHDHSSGPFYGLCHDTFKEGLFIIRSYPPFLCLDNFLGVSSIFLRVHKSKNEPHKPRHTFWIKMVNWKLVFN
jgi:hypothetical protein